MPKYFIDYQDGDNVYFDSVGSNLSSIDIAIKEALRLLSEFVKFVLPETGSSKITTAVRDESNKELYRASLIYHAEHLDQSLRSLTD